MKGSFKSQVFYLIKSLNGIGRSKKDWRTSSDIFGQNGHQVSPLIHSYKYQNDVKNTALQLASFAYENYTIRDIEKINNEIIYKFIEEKIEQGLKFRTISTYIGHMQKIFLGLQNIARHKGKKYSAFDEFGLQKLTQLKKEKTKKSLYQNRAYKNTASIISNFENEDNKLVAKLQVEAGVRVAEGLKFKPEQFKSNNMIEVKIKGGNKILVKVSNEIYNKLKTRVLHACKNGKIGLKIEYKDYYKDFKNAVEMANEKWTGTHGLRYSYAQRRMAELALDATITFEEARLIVSKEMGHKRSKITSHYLG
ncbi:MAG: tyrosine-type recombinase/integrase [Campylobacterota bacterium]|nr:tyrosine-type recombinase/integrase [Campylobacterota bacterium]